MEGGRVSASVGISGLPASLTPSPGYEAKKTKLNPENSSLCHPLGPNAPSCPAFFSPFLSLLMFGFDNNAMVFRCTQCKEQGKTYLFHSHLMDFEEMH